MKEVISDIQRWRRAGRRVAVARVVGLEGSGPRDPGATMAVNELGEVAGSVSGGCVEGAVVAESLAALAAGAPRRCTFGYSDEEAFSVGLTCGGTIHVLVTPEVPSVYDPLREALEAERPVVLATVVETEAVTAAGTDAMGALPVLGADLLVPADGPMQGSLGGAELDEVVRRDALGALAGGLSATRHYGRRGEARMREVGVFLEVFAAPPHMVVLGAVDFTAALVKVAKVLGYRVTVCDARPAFATRTRFPLADEIVADQPARYLASIRDVLGPRDAVCVLTHDTKFDVPAITAALATNVGYLGAMGSRRTHSDRLERLRRSNIDQSELDRVMAPIGLDIGARTPEETAVAICAEIIAMRTGRPAPSLRDRTGPVHHPTSSPQPAAL
ncbi:MAG: XdhC family protein [Acidimicrobiales bacterium]